MKKWFAIGTAANALLNPDFTSSWDAAKVEFDMAKRGMIKEGTNLVPVNSPYLYQVVEVPNYVPYTQKNN